MVYTSYQSRIFMGRYGTGDPSSDPHVPMNKLKGFVPPDVKYTTVEETTMDKLAPNMLWSGEKTPGDAAIPMWLGDPWFLFMAFPHKTVTGTWGAGNTGTISGDFAACTGRDQVWVQRKLPESCGGGTDLDELYFGGRCIEYHMLAEKGKLIEEAPSFKFMDEHRELHDMNGATAFHDDSWDETAAAQVSTIVAKAKASVVAGSYIELYGADGAGNQTKYYVWFDVAGDNALDPQDVASTMVYKDNKEKASDWTEIRVDVSGDTTAQEVSDAITAAITGEANFGAVNGGGASTTITITNANNGRVWPIEDNYFNPSALTVATTTSGAYTEGGWANWDTTGLVDCDGNGTNRRSPLDTSITWNTVNCANSMKIESFDVALLTPIGTTNDTSTKTHDTTWQEVRGFMMTLTGKITNLDLLKELRRDQQYKKKGDLIFNVDLTAGEEKYIKFTNAFVSADSTIPENPESGGVADITIVFKCDDPAVTAVFKYLGLPDPSDYINTT